MPPGIPTWFIARSHRFSKKTHWRTGVLLEHNDGHHLALVKADRHRNFLELAVRGPSPAGFFSILDDGLNLTLERFPGLDIIRQVPCPCQDANAGSCTERFDYDDLRARLARTPSRDKIECRKSGDFISVPQLLLGLAPSERDAARMTMDQISKALAQIDGKLDMQGEYMQRMFPKPFRPLGMAQGRRSRGRLIIRTGLSLVTLARRLANLQEDRWKDHALVHSRRLPPRAPLRAAVLSVLCAAVACSGPTPRTESSESTSAQPSTASAGPARDSAPTTFDPIRRPPFVLIDQPEPSGSTLSAVVVDEGRTASIDITGLVVDVECARNYYIDSFDSARVHLLRLGCAQITAASPSAEELSAQEYAMRRGSGRWAAASAPSATANPTDTESTSPLGLNRS
jgi:hypothetical protein